AVERQCAHDRAGLGTFGSLEVRGRCRCGFVNRHGRHPPDGAARSQNDVAIGEQERMPRRGRRGSGARFHRTDWIDDCHVHHGVMSVTVSPPVSASMGWPCGARALFVTYTLCDFASIATVLGSVPASMLDTML